MGVVYTGRYKRLTGIVNKIDIEASAPPLMASNIGWLDIPVRRLTACGGDHLAVTTTRTGAYTYSTQLGYYYPITTASVFVYKLGLGTSLPESLIAEIPRPVGFNQTPSFVKMSPSGKYLAIRWANKASSALQTTYETELYEIKENAVEKLPFWANNCSDFDWSENDDYLVTTWNQSQSGNTVWISRPKSPTRREMQHYVDSNYPVRFITSNHYMARTQITGQGIAYRIYQSDGTANTVSYMMDLPEELAAEESGYFLSYHTAQEGTGGDGYIVKMRAQMGQQSPIIKLDLFAFSGGSIFKLGDTTQYQDPRYYEENFFYSTGSAMIMSRYSSYWKEHSSRVFSIDNGLKIVADHEQIPPHIDLVHARRRDRILAVDHATVTAHTLTSSGFRRGVTPPEPRFEMALTQSPSVTRAIYPIQPVFTNCVTETVGGVAATRVNGSITFDSFNFLDFMSVEGTMEWWWKPIADNNISMFSFGNMGIQITGGGNARIDLELRTSGDGIHSSIGNGWKASMGFAPPTEWQHFLIARNKQHLELYINGLLSWSLNPSIGAPDTLRQPSVGMFNNRPVTFSNGYFRDIRITKGKASNLRVAYNSTSAIGFEPNDYQAIKGKAWVAPPGGRVERL